MSVIELREFIDKLAISQAETDRLMKETFEHMARTDASVDRMAKNIDKLSGSIGREW